ncbi:hypothetical protein [Rubellicoccus peritrichatus]|uniref:PEP-CTERM protein-sorting domain-containing protein n=1 Tax=Rubellicoccus peritrichatus TaxID=3080537 RepID=A0AAQ3LEU9_9BACT|nr:hypothetical protein [Puniceicoccus sp. CR14]WOO43284.1 hypothetical protein RZN69_09295 [Puniceicoccus sp. CR14]
MIKIKTHHLLPLISLCTLTASANILVEWDFENASDPGTNQTFSTATTTPASGVTINAPVAGANRIDIPSTLSGTNSRKTLSVSDVTNAGGSVALGDIELQFSPFLIQGVWPTPDAVFDDDYLEFEVSPDSGNQILSANLSYDVRILTGSDTTGGLSVESAVYFSTDGGTNWTMEGDDSTSVSSAGFHNTLDTHSISLSNITQSTLVRIALSDNSSSSAAFADSNTRKAINLDNIRLEGTVSPIPEPSMIGLGTGLTVLFYSCFCRRKEKEV